MNKINVISFGAGKQSTYMLLNALEGRYKYMPDLAVYSDLQCEPKKVVAHVKWITKFVKDKYNFDIITVSSGNLMNEVLDFAEGKLSRCGTIPFYVKETGAPLRRQCTGDFKIKPMRKYLQKIRGKKSIRLWIGISADESERMKNADVQYIENWYPLVEERIRIDNIKQWFLENGYDEPMKSACLICPFHSLQYWQNLKKNFPLEFEEACDFDDRTRKLPKIKSDTYIYRKLIPLRLVDFTIQPSLFPELIEECEGLCGL